MIHVAVGIIKKAEKVLISKRSLHQHQPGKWEFPGGKVETGECVDEALFRELKEELNIFIQSPKPLFCIKHHYRDKIVGLDVWMIEQFQGVPKGMENQPLMWKSIASLKKQDFPAANDFIVDFLQRN